MILSKDEMIEQDIRAAIRYLQDALESMNWCDHKAAGYGVHGAMAKLDLALNNLPK